MTSGTQFVVERMVLLIASTITVALMFTVGIANLARANPIEPGLHAPQIAGATYLCRPYQVSPRGQVDQRICSPASKADRAKTYPRCLERVWPRTVDNVPVRVCRMTAEEVTVAAVERAGLVASAPSSARR